MDCWDFLGAFSREIAEEQSVMAGNVFGRFSALFAQLFPRFWHGRQPGRDGRIRQFFGVDLQVTGVAESLIQRGQSFGLEAVTGVVNEQGREWREGNRRSEIACATQARNR